MIDPKELSSLDPYGDLDLRVDEENGSENEDASFTPASPEEQRFCAELLSFLESETHVDLRRLRLWMREQAIHLQGSVESAEQRAECEERLRSYPGVREVVNDLTIVKESLSEE